MTNFDGEALKQKLKKLEKFLPEDDPLRVELKAAIQLREKTELTLKGMDKNALLKQLDDCKRVSVEKRTQLVIWKI